MSLLYHMVPVMQKEAGRELLSPLDDHKSMGLDGVHPGVMMEMADKPSCEATLHHLPTVLAHW